MLLAADPGSTNALLLTLPLWPLIGAILVGATLALNRGRAWADKFVVGGSALAALLSIVWFLSFDAGHAAPSADVAAPAAHAADAPPAGTDPAPAGRAAKSYDHTISIFHWFSLGAAQGVQQWVDVNYYVDPLTIVMLLVVTIVATMVIIYSIGYMRDHHGHAERGYERFFAFLGLFVFSMVMLVLAGNFVLLYLGWELVGLCSYLLIGFYYPKPEAAAAAKKAFLVNRIGDFGFALGIFALYLFLSPHAAPGQNPLDYEVAFALAGQMEAWQLTTVALLLLCGALGKSAQLPLYVWLPDAMEGPSPVSALIHAATMVTAGVYMVARCGPIFAHSPLALDVITTIGVAGALFAATMAMAQYDMKRILAYSTMSQLAYMFAGLGCGAPDSAIFHLYTHAFFKALLFLTAGNVMHAMGNVIDVRQFSGLRAVLPTTYRLMGIGCLALAGLPLLAGFWSKDEIIHAAFDRHPFVGLLLLLTAAMTAYYTFRMFFLCFHGPLRLPPEAGHHPHDMPAVMMRPLYVLAAGAVFAGYVGVQLKASIADSFLGVIAPHGAFHHYLETASIEVTAKHGGGGAWLMYLSGLIAIGGIYIAYRRYGAAPAVDPDAAALGGVWRLWNAKYYVDEIYDRVFVRPLRKLGDIFFATDRIGIDGLVWFFGMLPRGAGAVLRTWHVGALQAYALGMAAGVAGLLLVWRWLDAANVG
ncbi:MAG: NADH-quinone oxidoreductase subunit L [Phycisphaerae bacterium]